MTDTPPPESQTERRRPAPASRPSAGSGTVALVNKVNPDRRIVGMMGFTVIFSLLGVELRAATPASSKTVTPHPAGSLSTGAKVILGGSVATALLCLLAEQGDAGAELGTGLAAVSLVTALFVNGGDVWAGALRLFGGKPTTGTSSTTKTGTTGNPAPAARISNAGTRTRAE